MMETLNALAKWDESALTLSAGKANRNVYEFNLNLWGLLHQLAQHSEGCTILNQVFGLNDDTIATLQEHPFEKLRLLAGHVLLSFVLATNESEVLTALEQEYDPAIYLSLPLMNVDEFESGYLLLLNREATLDPMEASVIFGVSLELAQAVAQASDTQLRGLRTARPLQFKLRYNQSKIKQSLCAESAGMTYLQRIQQSLK